jgi:hypothetical protein
MKTIYVIPLVGVAALISAGLTIAIVGGRQPERGWKIMPTCSVPSARLDIAKVEFTDISPDTPRGNVYIHFKNGNAKEKPDKIPASEVKHKSTELDFQTRKYLKKEGEYLQIDLTIPSGYIFPDADSVDVDELDGYAMFCRGADPVSADGRSFTFYVKYVPSVFGRKRIGAYALSVQPVIPGSQPATAVASSISPPTAMQPAATTPIGSVLRRQVDPNVKNSGWN